VRIFARTADGCWLQIEFQDKLAWVYTNLVDLDRELDGVPAADDIPPAPTLAAPSSSPTPEGGPTVNDVWDFRVIDVSSEEIRVVVDYSYTGESCAEVSLGAAPFGQNQSDYYGYYPVFIQRGFGSATIRVVFSTRTYTNPLESRITDQIRVHKWGCEQMIYESLFDYQKTWSKPIVSLVRSQKIKSRDSIVVETRLTMDAWPSLGSQHGHQVGARGSAFAYKGLFSWEESRYTCNNP
jgi:hypothetical protein